MGVKRIFSFFVFFLFFSSLIVSSYSVDGVEEGVENLEDNLNGVVEKDYESEYLKREWGKIIEDNPVGKLILGVSDFIDRNFGNLIESVLGVSYSLSWEFIFALILFACFFWLFYYPLNSFFENGILSVLSSFAISSLVGIGGGIKFGVGMFSSMISTFWVFSLSFLLLILILFLMKKLGFIIGKAIEAEKKLSEKENIDRSKKTIKTHGDISKKELDKYDK